MSNKNSDTHTLLKPSECKCSNSGHCNICDNGLAYCKICHGGEVELEEESCEQRRLRLISEIIERGDQRLLASDGPVGNQPPNISLKEWRRMYLYSKGEEEDTL